MRHITLAVNTAGGLIKKDQSRKFADETYFDFHIPGFEVESNLKLKVFYNRSENLSPVVFQRGVSVGWDGDFAHLI